MLLLHLSDLHFGNKNRFSNDKPADLGKAFHRALEAARKERQIPDSVGVSLVIVTGDITESGLPSEFRAALEFLVSLARQLGLPPARFVLLPGNHDVSWADCRIVRAARDGEKFPVAEFETRLNAEKFANYHTFLSHLYGMPVSDENLAGLETARPLGRGGWLREFSDLRLSVAALNTCERENDQSRGGFLSTGQAQALMTFWREDAAASQLKVLAMHHNPISTTDANRDSILTWLREKEKASGAGAPMSTDVFEHYMADIAGFVGSEHLPKIVQDTCAHLVLHGHHHDQGKPNSWHWKKDGNAPVLSVGSFGLNKNLLPGDAPLSCQLVWLVLPPEPKAPRLIAIPLVYDGRFRLEGDVLDGAFRPEAASRAAYDQPLPLPKGWASDPKPEVDPPISPQAKFLGAYEHLSYDKQPVLSRSLDDLDQELIKELLAKPLSQDLNADLKLGRDGRSPTVLEQLANLGCLYAGRPTLGALLCFAPGQLLTDKAGCCTLQMAIHDASERGGERSPISLARGNLLLLYKKGMSWLTSGTVLRRRGQIGSGSRDDLEIPEMVLREALANALVHRDYESKLLQEQPTRIDVYPDKVEITSYGLLLNEVPLELLNSPDQRLRPFRRNPVIASVFQCMTLAELNASGVQRMRRLMTEAGLALPLFRTSENFVCVTLARPFEVSSPREPTASVPKAVRSTRKAFISSTADLREHRAAAHDACLRAGVIPIMWEELQPAAEGIASTLVHYMDQADLFICIVGNRYGSISPNEEISFVELEFNRAVERGLPILVFTMHRDHPVTIDAIQVDAAGREKLKRFKERVATEHMWAEFKSPEDLRNRLIEALASLPDSSFPEPKSASFRSDISRIVRYAPAELIGREAETKLLSDAWEKAVRGEPERPHVLTFVALGGEGKTALVAKWAAGLAHRDWPGCDAAFAWSFYSQGTRDQHAASSDTFLKEALTFFGDPAMAGSAQGSFEKGRCLAQLVGERRALLVLDGVEPLQYAPTSPTPGEFKDQGLAALLKGLAASSHGLCVVTTRYSIADLRAYWQTAAPEVKLMCLSAAAGVALLKRLGVKGNQKELEALVADVKGHALTLSLLGTYLRDAHGGDFRRRDLVKLEEADAEEQGGHAFHVMDAYVKSLEAGGKTAEESERTQRALALLSLLGLFDRPATADCLEALWEGDAIAGLTDVLVGISESQRNVVLRRLEEARLLTVNRDVADQLVYLDAHPLIREYFARRLRQRPAVWQAAHRRLYEHLCATTKEGSEPTLEDLQPLYQAVAHGCQAGLQWEACDNVYRDRILRGTGSDGFYSTKKLGAFGCDLGAVARFFETPWSRVSPMLKEADQAWLLNEAAFRLRALGRLTEALEPMRAGLPIELKREDWRNAAIRSSNLSELELTLGQVAGAVGDAEQSVTYADRSGDAFLKLAVGTTHADALHQGGRRAEAEARFRETEQMQAESQPDYRLLYSLRGFKYCDLLLTETERATWQRLLNSKSEIRNPKLIDSCRAVERRAAQTLKWVMAQNWLLDIALDHLTLGRAALYRAIIEESEVRNSKCEIEQGVDGIRRSGNMDDLPRGLLTRAALRLLEGDADGARADLDEAWEIAERGPMRLHMADIHLYRARLFHTATPYPWDKDEQGKPSGAKDDLDAARKLIEQCGYWRRKEELEDAEEAAKSWYAGPGVARPFERPKEKRILEPQKTKKDAKKTRK